MNGTLPTKPLLVLDYEGTLGTSVLRHFVQYVEALKRLSERLGARLDTRARAMLEPLDQETFLARYTELKRVGLLLPIANVNSPEALFVQALLDQLHSEIIWEYQPEHMLHERVIAGVLQNLPELASRRHCIIVSYTRQGSDDFADHLQRLGLLGDNLIARADVVTVGADGKKSREAKASAIISRYGRIIEEQQAQGLCPALLADATDDMSAAFDAKLAFVGVSATGKSSLAEFEKALNKERETRETALKAHFIESAGIPDLAGVLDAMLN